MSISDAIKNGRLTGGGLPAFRSNAPDQYADRLHQYYESETKAFRERYLRYGNDFMEAQVQGLDLSDPFGWRAERIRMADVVRPTAAIQRGFDDYKSVIFENPTIDYLKPGTKIVAMGSTWLVTNPQNVSSGGGIAVVQRCNTTWNFLDWYGNIVSEPIVVENLRAYSSETDPQENTLINKGYFNVIAQYNAGTAQMNTNTRMILGTGGYRVTGYADFFQEFTGDYSSVDILKFTIRYEEPNAQIDDIANHVANGKTFAWGITIDGPTTMVASQEVQITAASQRMGVDVESSEEHPISYLWQSDNDSVATVDENGLVTAVGEGEAVITATLEQNPDILQSMTIAVSAALADEVRFTSTVPDSMDAWTDAIITAAYFEDGAETAEPLTWSVDGADKGSFSYIAQGKELTLYCYSYSATPLKVSASYGDYSTPVAEIRLVGGF